MHSTKCSNYRTIVRWFVAHSGLFNFVFFLKRHKETPNESVVAAQTAKTLKVPNGLRIVQL